jgi:predicted metal-binding membrane protein
VEAARRVRGGVIVLRAFATDRAFIGVTAAAFALAVAVTGVWCGSMASMPAMDMPGGWTMSMAWMRMPGQSWPGAAATFLGMWIVMMVAMMLPVLAPKLLEYRASMRGLDAARRNRFTLVMSSAYFFVWAMTGIAAYPLGLALNAAAMENRSLSLAMPWIASLSLIAAGTLQFSTWKKRELDCCRKRQSRQSLLGTTPWRHGLQLGVHCVQCCAGPSALLFVLGVMDLRAMALVTALIAVERLAPGGERIARATGMLLIGAGIWLPLSRIVY